MRCWIYMHSDFIMGILNIIANIFTIAGVVVAVIFYFRWKKDYKLQKSHEYALELLKKTRSLHFEIEVLRGPKFHHPEDISERINSYYIPQIEEKIFEKSSEIQTLLLSADDILLKKGLQSKFNEKVKKQILRGIGGAIYEYRKKLGQQKPILYDDLKQLKILEIIFPSEIMGGGIEITESYLGTGLEVINDEFNKKIEDGFNEIYKFLQENMVKVD